MSNEHALEQVGLTANLAPGRRSSIFDGQQRQSLTKMARAYKPQHRTAAKNQDLQAVRGRSQSKQRTKLQMSQRLDLALNNTGMVSQMRE